ncbi:7bdc82f8-309e-475b-923f-46d5e2c2b127 [Thermothielavioides terrestris]|uniref:7bdc82f8-309e-475b-923f-46d5e2c2b127 n=1 Tax=Thermothielavioides terrestris TaxID=2587410 RepID=A0A3S4APG9_9PEZI|nr:7bdc82f8-309e-475b-923f-46d5e2c2b127 [Thermothielavioides terrestris]
MSTAVAMAPSPAPHDRPSYATAAPGNASAPPSRSGSGSPKGAGATLSTQKSSPPSASRPKIVVKKEPGSPGLPTGRHRPRKLDLSNNTSIVSPATGRPLTGREGLGIQEVGIACLSPGFVPKDATEQEQLNRSMTVREHQRQIIEARLQQQSAKLGDGPDKDKDGNHGSHFAAKTPGLARKRGAPPGLSIVAPSHEQFANERVIQSAPLGQTFTGRHNPHPLTRHITNQPSNLASTSHIHHVPATQTNNRLPPIADVFGQSLSGHPDSSSHALFASQNRGPLPSPHHPPPQASRPREYKTAEEAQAELAGGRPELMPNTRNLSSSHAAAAPAGGSSSSSSTMKRRRAEYEEGGSPPLGNGARPAPAAPLPYGASSTASAGARRGPFGEGRDSPDTMEAKKEEFLSLCARAWDLFHS